MDRIIRMLATILLGLGLLCLVVACGKRVEPGPAHGLSREGITITGKVTYKDQAITYGFVQFFDQHALDPKSGMMYPVAVGMITREGKYIANNVPTGKDLHIAVACDPNRPLRELSGHVTGVNLLPGMPDPSKMGPAKDKQPPPPKRPPGMPAGKAPPPPGGSPLQHFTEEKKKLLSEAHRQFSSPMISGQFHSFATKDTEYDIHLVAGKKK
jgi:hypothetical protein